MYTKRDACTCTTVYDVVQRNTGCADEILNGPSKAQQIKNAKEAAKMIEAAVANNEHIAFVGDYDVDGICATSIMILYLKSIGYTNYEWHIPLRMTEGYGINQKIIDKIPEGSFLITADNGIAAIDQIKAAKEKGMKVLLTDHHQPIVKDGVKMLPEADLIVDPHATGECDFSEYCGAGLMFKILNNLVPNGSDISFHMLSLAALATVADVVSLVSENHKIVKIGMNAILAGKCQTGVRALIEVFECELNLTEDDIGYYIAPAINAASRMRDDGASDVVRLFIGEADPMYMSEYLKDLNEKRKAIANEKIDEAVKMVVENGMTNDFPIVIRMEDVLPTLNGLISGRLTELFNTPSYVFSSHESTGDVLKGSARSVEGFALNEQIDRCREYFLGAGGHAMAAGCSVMSEGFDALKEALQKDAQGYEKPKKECFYDLEIDADEAKALFEELQRFAPFGEGNPAPIIKIKDFRLEPGKDGQCYAFRGDRGDVLTLFNRNLNATGFGLAQKYERLGFPIVVDAIGCINFNHYRGVANNKPHEYTSFELKLEDIEAEEKDNLSPFGQMLLKKFLER